MQFKINNEQFIHWLNMEWDIEFKSARRDIDIYGSPERALSRIVIEDKKNRLFLLEKFSRDKFFLRRNVAKAMEYLNSNGLKEALPYRKTKHGEFLPFFNGSCYEISLFLKNTGVKRPEHLESEEIGKNFASFLLNLSNASADMGEKIVLRPFSIKEYIYKLFSSSRLHP